MNRVCFTDLIHSEDINLFRIGCRAILTGEAPKFKIELRINGRKNSLVWSDWEFSVRHYGGDLPAIVGLGKDITEFKKNEIVILSSEREKQKVIEEELKRNRERYSAVIDSMQEGVIIYDLEGKIIDCNRSAERILEFRRSELLGLTHSEPVWKIIKEDKTDFMPEEIPVVSSLRTGLSYRNTIMGIYKRSGNLIWISGSSQILCHPESGIPFGAAQIFHDITEMKIADEKLRANREFLNNLIDSLPGYVYRVANDSAYTPLYISESVYEITGYTQSEYLTEKTILCGREIHPEFAERVRESLQKALDEKKPYEFEYKIITKSGSEKWVWEKGRGIFDDSGQPRYLEGFVSDITDTISLKEKLISERGRLYDIIEAANVGTWQWNIRTGEVIINKKWTEIAGYGFTELMPFTMKVWISLIHPDDFKISRTLMKKHLAGKTDFYLCEIRIKHKDGNWVWVLSRGKVLSRKNGKLFLMSGTIQDINSKKVAEEKNKEILDRFTKIALHLPGFIFLFRMRPDGTFDLPYASNGIKEIFEIDPEDVKDDGAPIFRIIHPDDKELVITSILASAASLTPWQQEWRIIQKDGRVLWLGGNSSPTRQENGNIVWFGYCSNITEEKLAEQNLQESELKQKTILETILDSVLIINRLGIIQMANRATEKIFGYRNSDIIGKNISILMPEPYSSMHDIYIKKYLETGNRHIIGIGREVLGRKKSGEIFPCELSVSEWDFKGEKFFTGTIHDISYKKIVEEQLKQSQKMEALGQIAGGVAHDFNNILAVIMGNVELLERKIQNLSDESMKKNIQKTLNAVERGSHLTSKLLSFARKQNLNQETADINHILQDMKDMIERVIGKHIQIILDLYSEPLPIMIDKNEMENVILNLAINARDAMTDSGTLTIRTLKRDRISAPDSDYVFKPGKEYAEITVSDTGRGIPAEIIQKIYEPFFTTKGAGKGTGLGLSMTYSFVKQFKGFISVKSTVNRGTSFTLSFPLQSQEITEADALDSYSEEKPVSKNRGSVLIVDDEPSVLEIASSILAESGYIVMKAESAQEALSILSEKDADIVITDIIMPGEINGLELARIIRKEKPYIRIILTSGYPGDLRKKENSDLSEFTFIAKPYKALDLEKTVRKELDKKS
ncbi:MAG TPA: PAS domain S-box protein [Leptospiraceae bacterium]|nr:PAS domain S-box protein [Leptospiraceae bacterium]HNN04073.1 PAS domain S-box protein [Leptospiraceae bacterium]